MEGYFIVEDLQNLSFDYSKTIAVWRRNFEDAWISSGLNKMYGDRFYKVWTIYLSLAEAAFQTRSFQLYQFVLSKDGIRNGYRTERLLSS